MLTQVNEWEPILTLLTSWQPKWIQMKPRDDMLTYVNPSEPKWTQVNRIKNK